MPIRIMPRAVFTSCILTTLKWAFFLLSVHFGIGWAFRGADKIEYLIDLEHINIQLYPIGHSVTLTYIFAILSIIFAFLDKWFEIKLNSKIDHKSL